MKWIFGFFGVLITILSTAQSSTKREQQLLSKMQLDVNWHEVAFYSETEFGKFITVRKIEPIDAIVNDEPYLDCISRTFDTYLQIDEDIFPIKSLRGYRAFDYSVDKKVLVVGKYDVHSLTDSGIEELYKFDPNTEQLTKLGTYAGGIYGVQVKHEKMFLLLYAKNVGGIGSYLLYVPFQID